MEVKVLGSSSKGNCYIIDDCLILEAGINIKELKKALNFDFSKVLGCLVTHEHGDHIGHASTLASYGINIYSTKGTFDNSKHKIIEHRRRYIKPLEPFLVEGYKILPFHTEHDVVDSVGFLIQKIDTGETLLFATDTYYLRYTFKSLNYIMIECNYSEKILNEKEKLDSVDRRRYTTHMSLETLKDTLRKNDLSRCSQIILLHLSDNNSNSRIFEKEIEDSTGVKTDVAEKDNVYELCKDVI